MLWSFCGEWFSHIKGFMSQWSIGIKVSTSKVKRFHAQKMSWINPITISHPKLCWQRKCTIHKANTWLYFMPKTFFKYVLVGWRISSNTLTSCMGGYILNQYRQSSFLREITCLLGCIVGIMHYNFSPWNQFLNGLLAEIMEMVLPHENIFLVQENTRSLMFKNKTYEWISSSNKSHELGIFLA